MSNKDDKTLKYINEYYNNREIKLDFESLSKMITEQMDHLKSLNVQSEIIKEEEYEDIFEDLFEELEKEIFQSNSLLSEESGLDVEKGKENISIQLPKFTVTESWGDPTSDSFKQIKPFVLRAAGKGKTYEEKFNHLQRMFEGRKTKITSPGRILATLILLESWVAIIRDFSPSAAGFLFEAFLAAITFGEQIADPDDGGTLPIEDIVAFGTGPDGQPASLKLLKKSTSIKGSYKNLVEYFTKNSAIDYIVAYKLAGTDEDIRKGNLKLKIMKYEVNRDNFLTFLLSGSINNKKLLTPGLEDAKARSRIQKISSLGWNDLQEYLIQTTAGVTDKTQWQISRPQFDKLEGIVQLADVDLTIETMRKLNTYWADQLGEQIRDLFHSVATLSENINKFFLDTNRQGAKNGAKMAIKNTETIKDNITGSVKQEDEVK